MRSIILLGLMVATTSVAAPKKSAKPQSVVLAQAREAVAQILRDPRSAQFQNVRHHVDSADGMKVICGEVNGKNAYGGYVGFRRFIYIPQTGDAVIAPSDSDFEEMSIEERAAAGKIFVKCY